MRCFSTEQKLATLAGTMLPGLSIIYVARQHPWGDALAPGMIAVVGPGDGETYAHRAKAMPQPVPAGDR